jgi:phosphoribosylanthranilate isomerase
MLATAADTGRVQIKICGITNPTDAALAVALGADMLGFNFYPGSARCLELRETRTWLRELPAGVRKLAVVVNQLALGREIYEACLVDALQLHGDEDETACAELHAAGIPFVKALRVRDASTLVAPERFHTAELLLDAFQPDSYGGTGSRFDWSLAERFVAAQPTLRIILSGGLTPENVAAAVRQVRPYAVDVASGVEVAGDPRRKDPARLRGLIEAVRG